MKKSKMNKTKFVHYAFRITTAFKGIYSFLEMLSGVLLLVVSSSQIISLINRIFSHELLQDPHDLVVNFLIHTFSSLSSIQSFVAWYFIIHGLIKFGLIAALWADIPIAYPVAVVVFILFIAYQAYKYTVKPSWIYIYLTVLDLIVVVLTILEYKHVRYLHEMKKAEKLAE